MTKWAAIPLALVAALAPFAACSDGTSAAPEDAGTTDTSNDDGRTPADRTQDSAPELNVDGWIKIDYPNCSFWAAPSPDKMPAPLEWEACSSPFIPPGLVCRQLRSGSTAAGWVDANGKVWLSASRPVGNRSLDMVAEADGRVHQAITYGPGDCVFTTIDLNDDKVIYAAVRPKGQVAGEERGAIGGSFDGVPVALEHWADGKGRDYYAGPASYFALGPDNAVRQWIQGAPLGTVPLTDPGQIGARRFVGEDLFYEIGNLSYSRIKVYSPATGARDLVSFGNDVAANAGDFGTDGIDMVWIEAFGRASSSDPWSTMNIMTAKFTPDAMQVAKRRLRSENSALGVFPFTVGCGYAGHFVSTLKEGNIVRIVRLSDGHSWKLSEAYGDGGGYWFPQTVRAISCDEIFLRVDEGDKRRGVRIRLDSLGPGEPAD